MPAARASSASTKALGGAGAAGDGPARISTPAAVADAALLDGADLFVLSPGIPAVHPFVRAAGAAGIAVISEIELAFRCCAAPVVAITGSKGKSTTTALAGALLAAQGKHVAVAGNIGLPFSAVVAGLDADAWVVLELSSFQLETVDTLHARIAVLLGVSPDHLDRYADLEAYAAAKMRIARHQDAGDWLIVDPQDRWGAMLARRSPARVAGFSTDWQGDGVVRAGSEPVARRRSQRNVVRGRRCAAPRRPQPAQCDAALAVARTVRPVGESSALRCGASTRRHIACNRPARSPASASSTIRRAPLDAVAAGVEGLDGAILLGMGGRNKGLDFTILRPHLERVRAALLLGEAADEIERALGGTVPVHRVRDLDDMVARGLEIGVAGDTFLFSPGCTSFDMFHNAEERGAAFDAAVRQAADRVRGVGRT